MTHKEQLLQTLAVADSQAYGLIQERRETAPADVEALKEIRRLTMQAHALAKKLAEWG
jgi:hypothetical protein